MFSFLGIGRVVRSSPVVFSDPTHVIGLYPDLLPADYRKQLHYPNPLPTLSGAELEKAHLALIDYLTQV